MRSARDPVGAPDLGPLVREQGLPGEKDPSGPRVDALELLLAAVGPSMRSLPAEGPSPERLGKLVLGSPTVEIPIIDQVVQRVFIGGDRRRGIARIDLAGDYAGTTVWVRGEGSAVELEVILGPGLSGDGLSERLLGRLRESGLHVASFEVR